MTGTHTPGEILFEQYLQSQAITFEFEKQHLDKTKRPDYTKQWENQTVILDVKDFDPPERGLTGFGYFDPYTRIREKIEQGRDKFKQYKEFCCGLILHNLGNPFVSLHEPDIMLGAMYGDSGFTFPIDLRRGVGDTKQLKRAFLNRIRPNRSEPQNTTISALITLVKICPHYLQLLDLVRENPGKEIAEHEANIRNKIPNYDPQFEVPRVIVWHNAVARIAFPKSLFRGPYDTHFDIVRVGDGELEQDVTWEGAAVPDRLRLLQALQWQGCIRFDMRLKIRLT